MRCHAITERTERWQQVWRKDCENTACHMIDGVALCGSHVNALGRKDIWVRTLLPQREDVE